MTTHELIHSSLTNEWYTPPEYIERVRAVLGGIDLDPASCEAANRIVQAAKYYALPDNGLLYTWYGRVFCNPPYGRNDSAVSNQAVWSLNFWREYQMRNIRSGILLVNAVTDRNWFKDLWHYSICFVYDRIKFIDADGVQQKQPTHGNAFVYFGTEYTKFKHEFCKIGEIIPARKDR